jgi:hypothetical protein
MSERPRLRDRAVSAARERTVAALSEARRTARAAVAWLWARRVPLPRAAAISFAAATAALSGWAVLAQAGLPARLPAALDWAAARELLERDARPGDGVAISPPWAERAREILPASVPVFAQRRYAGEDLVGVRRMWLLSLRDAPWFSWEAEVDLLERARRADPAERLGAIEASRHDIAFPTLPLAFLPDRLARASVHLGDEECPPDAGGKFRCGDGTEVERAVREVAGVARPCLVATATAPQAAALRIAFGPVRLGRTLHGHVGRAGAPGSDRPIRIVVEVDGDEIGAVEVSPSRFAPFRVDMSRLAGQTRPLSLTVSGPGALAPLCLDASILP